MATVSALTLYPIKGCAGVVVERAEVTPTGLANDRLFAVVGPDGVSVWQGETPRLATVRGRMLHEGAKLALSAPGAGELVLDVAAGGAVRPVKVEKWPGSGIDQGDEAAEWLSGVVGRPVRLVREPHTEDRVGRMTIGGTEIGFGELAIRCAVTLVDQSASASA